MEKETIKKLTEILLEIQRDLLPVTFQLDIEMKVREKLLFAMGKLDGVISFLKFNDK